jgi:hypothetical protein
LDAGQVGDRLHDRQRVALSLKDRPQQIGDATQWPTGIEAARILQVVPISNRISVSAYANPNRIGGMIPSNRLQ